jgi:hypothetical protein
VALTLPTPLGCGVLDGPLSRAMTAVKLRVGGTDQIWLIFASVITFFHLAISALT